MNVFYQKIKREISKPTVIYTIFFISFIKFFLKLLDKIIYFVRITLKPKKIVFAYDLEIDPLTFDFLWFSFGFLLIPWMFNGFPADFAQDPMDCLCSLCGSG